MADIDPTPFTSRAQGDQAGWDVPLDALLTALASTANTHTAQITNLAPLASPALTGVPTVPTATVGTSSSQAASTAFVAAAAALKQNLLPAGTDIPSSPVEGQIWFQEFTTAADTTAPTAATIATPTIDSGNHVSLSWSGSTDASGVSYYELWRGTGSGSTPTLYITRIDGTVYTDVSVAPATTYKYQVKAVDVFGNKSALSTSINATTNAASLLTNPNLRYLYFTDTAIGAAAAGTSISTLGQPQYGSLVGALALTQSTGANQPTVATATLNGSKKVVQHVATGLQFINSGLPTTITGATTQYMVVNVTPAGATKSLLTGINSTPYRGFGLNASNRLQAIAGGTPATVPTPSGTNTAGVWKVLANVIDPSTGATRFFDNALTPVTGTLSTDTASNAVSSVRIGRTSGSSSAYTDMSWACVGMVEEAQSTADVQAGMQELATTFGITLGA